jgi:hypothetical protein
MLSPKLCRKAVIKQILSEPRVFAFKLPLTIGNEHPSDDPTEQRERGTNQELRLHTLIRIIERVLYRSEDLRPNCCTTAAAKPRKCPRMGVAKDSAPQTKVVRPRPFRRRR